MIEALEPLLEVLHSCPMCRLIPAANWSAVTAESELGANRWAASADHPGPAPARRAGAAAGRARLPGRTRRPNQLRDRRHQPGSFEAGFDFGRLSRRRPGRTTRPVPRFPSGFVRRPLPACISRPGLSPGGGRRRFFTPEATVRGGSGVIVLPTERGQDDSWDWRQWGPS